MQKLKNIWNINTKSNVFVFKLNNGSVSRQFFIYQRQFYPWNRIKCIRTCVYSQCTRHVLLEEFFVQFSDAVEFGTVLSERITITIK